MIPSKCEQEISLPCYFFDVNKKLRPAAFFDIAQDIAMKGAEMIGAPDWILEKRDVAWILTRMHVHYESIPSIYSKVRLQTWHAGVSGPMYIREYLMYDEQGNILVRATSSWVLMEISTRSIARAERIADILSPEPQCPERAIEDNAPKIVWPRGAEPELTASHKVLYSDVDYNAHANNARYPVWAYDILPDEFTCGRRISDFYINYNHELHPSETTGMYAVRRDQSSWIVEGKREDVQNFICRIDFD